MKAFISSLAALLIFVGLPLGWVAYKKYQIRIFHGTITRRVSPPDLRIQAAEKALELDGHSGQVSGFYPPGNWLYPLHMLGVFGEPGYLRAKSLGACAVQFDTPDGARLEYWSTQANGSWTAALIRISRRPGSPPSSNETYVQDDRHPEGSKESCGK